MDLTGKEIIAFGDSITIGHISPTETTPNTWVKIFGDITGATTTNLALNGTTMAVPTGSNQYHIDNAFCNRLPNLDLSDYDYIMLAYGTNDYGLNIPIGGKYFNTNTATFCGALNYVLGYLSDNYPNLKVIVNTPIWANTSVAKNSLGYTMYDYVLALMDMCSIYNVPVINLHDGLGINGYNIEDLYYDDLHPIEATYARIGTYVAGVFPGIPQKEERYWENLTVIPPASVYDEAPKALLDNNGFVHFVGRITVPTAGLVLNLPTKMRPKYNLTTTCLCCNGALGGINVFTDGRLTFFKANAIAYDLVSIPPYYAGNIRNI